MAVQLVGDCFIGIFGVSNRWFPAILASSCMVYLNVWASFTFVWNTKKHLTQRVQNLDDKLLEQKEISKSILENDLTGLSLKELQQLEQQLNEGLLSVKERKEQLLVEQLEQSRVQLFVSSRNSVLYLRMKRCADRHCSQKEVKKKESKKRFKTISMTKKFSCRPKDLFEILMDENRWKIWRFGSWPDGIDSTICQVRLKLEEPEPGLTIVKLTHSDIPEEDRYGNATVVENTERGWRDLIFQRIRAVFWFWNL
ncbi:unnamed protein product [Prunus armeniaca]|uniref:K-box domain-containing protein n=1 Tax=Prunus armeniaca TaxID=36596 RepID=A0A6J5TI12_PRUAR|nr:unnamed protein product [Prunus armeniaca]